MFIGQFFLSFLGWSETECTWYVGQSRMIDSEYGELGGMRFGMVNRRPDLGSNPGRRRGKSATNRLSYGTALLFGVNLNVKLLLCLIT
jgi:hypothetical protein